MDAEERVKKVGQIRDRPEMLSWRNREIENPPFRHAPLKDNEWLGVPIQRSPVRRMMRARFKARIAKRLEHT